MAVLERFRRDCEIATRINVTVNYGAAGSPVYGPRDGSVAWSEPAREAYARFGWILAQLDEDERRDLRDLVLCLPTGDNGAIMSLADVGRRLIGLTDKTSAKFAGIGLTIGLGRVLRRLYRIERALQASKPSTPEEIQRRREQRMASRVRSGQSDY
jgi:hypothetical protein